MSKKWYVWKGNISNPNPGWYPVDDVKFVRFDDDVACAVVRDHTDDRLLYCVHVARVKCMEIREG